ncbi:hypothetical protein SISNIDRAFT_535724 [Sistotremastrum niveocremeum HHB9708]|uniref:Hydrophobin n=1 Tax=Sistotremastrum niveocremeum HHB9708 TaxID=1314777 RepID=A0A164NBH6_9AGAM|nr:hypothetical protein SISNIDRAFT_535724 [Sistotremastrum niveocremeum HHB9708]
MHLKSHHYVLFLTLLFALTFAHPLLPAFVPTFLDKRGGGGGYPTAPGPIILPDICADLGIELDVIFTSLSKCASYGQDPTSLITELSVQLTLCAELILKTPPSYWNEQVFFEHCANLIINIQAIIAQFHLTLILSLIVKLRIDAILSLLLTNCKHVFINACDEIGLKISGSIIAVLVQHQFVLTVKVLGLVGIGL